MTADPYYRDWADVYDEHSRGVPGDVDYYVGLARQADGLVVELGVGTGRIAIPSAVAGARVLGIDLAPSMLAIARRRSGAAGVADRLELAEGDMRTFTTPEPAALVTIPFRAFLHNLTVEDQLATLEACRRALRPGGRLALNVFQPDPVLIARARSRSPRTWEPWGGPDSVIRARHTHDLAEQVVTTRLRRRGQGGRWVDSSVTLRWVYRFEMEHLFARAGLEVEALFGDFTGAPLVDGSREMVWLARRP